MKGVLLALDVAYEDVIVPESFLGGGIFLDLDEEKVVRYLRGFLCRFHCRFGVDVLCAPFYGVHLLGVLSPGDGDGAEQGGY